MSGTSTVERVARAMNVAEGYHPDAASNADYDETKHWELYIPLARAAIETMRDSASEEMIFCGYTALMEWDARTGEDLGINAIWKAMITAALQEQE